MGRRGPPPKPTTLKIAAGNPGRRPLNKSEPQPKRGNPMCPDWLDDEAKRHWEYILPILDSMRVLTVAEGDALVQYCRAYSRWKAAESHLMEHGTTYEVLDKDGLFQRVQTRPQVAEARSMLDVMHRKQQEFGLTPAARSRIAVAPERSGDSKGKARFFKRGG